MNLVKQAYIDLKNTDRIWMTIWIIIYATFLVGDFFMPAHWTVTLVKLTGLALCLVYAWVKFRHDHLLVIALALTILSDVILALDNVSAWGVFVFCFAHFFHMARLAGTAPRFFLAFTAFVILTFVGGILIGAEPVITIGLIYAVALASNVILAINWFLKSPKSLPARCACFGFIAFLACDLCVASSYLSLIGLLPLALRPIANYFAWFFYYPAQVLISNSSKTLKTVIQ